MGRWPVVIRIPRGKRREVLELTVQVAAPAPDSAPPTPSTAQGSARRGASPRHAARLSSATAIAAARLARPEVLENLVDEEALGHGSHLSEKAGPRPVRGRGPGLLASMPSSAPDARRAQARTRSLAELGSSPRNSTVLATICSRGGCRRRRPPTRRTRCARRRRRASPCRDTSAAASPLCTADADVDVADPSPPRPMPLTARRRSQTLVPLGSVRSSGSVVRRPVRMNLLMLHFAHFVLLWWLVVLVTQPKRDADRRAEPKPVRA